MYDGIRTKENLLPPGSTENKKETNNKKKNKKKKINKKKKGERKMNKISSLIASVFTLILQ